MDPVGICSLDPAAAALIGVPFYVLVASSSLCAPSALHQSGPLLL